MAPSRLPAALAAAVLALAIGATAAVAAPASSFRNPVVPATATGDDTPDPWMFRHDGRYWLTYTTKESIEVRSAATLAGLADARPTRLWPPAGQVEPAERSRETWAPEIHRLDGPDGPRWYVYYAANGPDEGTRHRMYVLESAGDDPAGPYRFRGRLALPQPFAIDVTVAEIHGRAYAFYSGGESFAPTSLYVAELRDPWTVAGEPLEISRPELPWEVRDLPINEGPEVLLHDGRLHLIYSASWCGLGNYAMGRLTVPAGANLLAARTWRDAKVPDPVFAGAPDRLVFGPGHGSFFTSPDGRESWMAYHATEEAGKGCFTGGLRTTRAQPFAWRADGTPDFGRPVALTTDLPAPGGDGTIAVQAEDARPAPAARWTPVSDRRLVGYEGLRLAGDAATLTVRVPQAGRYAVRLRVLGAPDAGALRATLGDRPAVARDLRRASERAVDLALGTTRLTRGRHVLGLRSAAPLVVDQLRLEPR